MYKKVNIIFNKCFIDNFYNHYFSIFIYKIDNFSYSIFSQIFCPLPIIYGFQQFHTILTIGDLSLLQLIIPRSLGEFSTIYGPSLILIFLIMNKKFLRTLITSNNYDFFNYCFL